MNEMRTYVEMFEPAFLLREQLELSQSYMQRLLGDAPRKKH
jgi:hypothetical protein